MADRLVYRITGTDRVSFLQNIVTNDVDRLSQGLVWTALLTPQGKYLADFFLAPEEDAILLDVAADLGPALMTRLGMYKLRADVSITETDIVVAQGTGDVPDGAFADPRDDRLGWRAYDGRPGAIEDWEALRISLGLPESGVELIPNDSFPLEVGFERWNGVDFKKGCYVGQEVTARMKHKTELRKGLRQVLVDGSAPIGTEIVNGAGKTVGRLFSQFGGFGLAFLRFDRVDDEMTAGDAKVRVTSGEAQPITPTA